MDDATKKILDAIIGSIDPKDFEEKKFKKQPDAREAAATCILEGASILGHIARRGNLRPQLIPMTLGVTLALMVESFHRVCPSIFDDYKKGGPSMEGKVAHMVTEAFDAYMRGISKEKDND